MNIKHEHQSIIPISSKIIWTMNSEQWTVNSEPAYQNFRDWDTACRYFRAASIFNRRINVCDWRIAKNCTWNDPNCLAFKWFLSSMRTNNGVHWEIISKRHGSNALFDIIIIIIIINILLNKTAATTATANSDSMIHVSQYKFNVM